MLADRLIAMGGKLPPWPNSGQFNGSTSYMSGSISIAASKQVTIAMCYDPNGDGTEQGMFSGIGTSSSTQDYYLNHRGYNEVIFKNAAGTIIFQGQGGNSAAGFNTFLMSIDLSNAAKRHIYLNDSTANVAFYTYTNDTITNVTSMVIGCQAVGTRYYNGTIAMLYIAPTYIDLSVQATRDIFFNASKVPLDLTVPISKGQIPTPAVCLPFQKAWGYGLNKGVGGTFTPYYVTDGANVA